ncbi:uncharacterized protein LJ264_014214 [Porphyrio hochstetteri]
MFFCSPRHSRGSLGVLGLDLPRLLPGSHWKWPPEPGVGSRAQHISLRGPWHRPCAFLQQPEALLEPQVAARLLGGSGGDGGAGGEPGGGTEPTLVPAAPAALLRLHQPQPVLVVQPGDSVNISCEASEYIETKAKASWYWRVRGKEPKLFLDCATKSTRGRFCEVKGRNITLSITRVDRHNTGIYLCAYTKDLFLDVGSGTMLVVGDSWSAGSWVMVLAPHGAPQVPPGPVCAVGNATGPVLVSRPGGPRKVLGRGVNTKLLISPLGTARGTGVLCEVRFNASGSPIRRSVELFRDTGEHGEHPPAGSPVGN